VMVDGVIVIHQRTQTLFTKERKRYSPKNTNVLFEIYKISFISNVLKQMNYCVMCKYVFRELLACMRFVLTCSILMKRFTNGFYIV